MKISNVAGSIKGVTYSNGSYSDGWSSVGYWTVGARTTREGASRLMATFTDPGGYGTDDATIWESMTIEILERADWSEQSDIELCYATKKYSGSDKASLYAYCGSAVKFATVNPGQWTDAIYYTITNNTTIKNIMTYGLILRESSANVREFQTWCAGIKISGSYYGSTSYPDIEYAMKNGTAGNWYIGTSAWYQMLDTDFYVSWTYKHTLYAQKSYSLQISYGYNDEWVDVFTDVQSKASSVAIPGALWRKQPFFGYLRLKVVAENGKGDWLAKILWAAPRHNIEITAPGSGSVVLYDENNTISWVTTAGDYSDANRMPEISGFNMEISEDNGATWGGIAEVSGGASSYTFGAYTLPIGLITYRVTPMYASNQVLSDKNAESKIVVKANPSTSSVSCDGKPIPTIYWTSTAQTSYQVRFGGYDSGAIYSTAKSHKVPYYFENGVYEVSVRTQIDTGEWSEWTEPIYVQITNVPPAVTITATANRDGFKTRLLWSKNTTFSDYIVYRDGVPIHVTDGGAEEQAGYMDTMANGKVSYFVRGITSSGYYAQSDTVTIDATSKCDLILKAGTEDFVVLRYTPSFPRYYNYQVSAPVILRYFAGRSKPVAIRSGRTERKIPLTYIDKGKKLAEKLKTLIGETVVFKDHEGGGIVGVIGEITTKEGFVTTVSFTVTEVDHNERVEYIPEQ